MHLVLLFPGMLHGLCRTTKRAQDDRSRMLQSTLVDLISDWLIIKAWINQSDPYQPVLENSLHVLRPRRHSSVAFKYAWLDHKFASQAIPVAGYYMSHISVRVKH